MNEEHEHSWVLANSFTITGPNQQSVLVLALFCSRCSEVISKIVPPPEMSPIQIVKPVLGIRN